MLSFVVLLVGPGSGKGERKLGEQVFTKDLSTSEKRQAHILTPATEIKVSST